MTDFPVTPPATLTREEADRVLAELNAAHGQISTAMFGIDTHAGHELLRAAEVSGATRKAWDEVKPAIEMLWAQFAGWRELLERAGEVRARRERPREPELAELEILLCEPVIGLDANGMPATGGDAPPATRLALADLAARMQASCAGVTKTLDTISGAHSTVLRQLDEAHTAMAEARTLAGSLGLESGTDSPGTGSGRESLAGRLADLAGQVSQLEVSALRDPLGAASDAGVGERLRRLVAELSAVRVRLVELDAFRSGYRSRLARLRGAISDLAALHGRAEQAYRVALAKIASPGLPPLRPEAAGFGREVGELERVAGEDQWERAEELAAGVEQAVAGERARAEQLLEAASGLLDRRDELRGRLQAYQAKAARLGVAEAPDVVARHARARELLWTSPCDLRAATSAVRRFQEAVQSAPDQGKGPR